MLPTEQQQLLPNEQKTADKLDLLQAAPLQYYLDLASEYYEQGYLADVKYLEAVAAENARKKAKKERRNAPNNFESCQSLIDCGKSIATTNFFRIGAILKSIAKKRSFCRSNWQAINAAENWSISVRITPTTAAHTAAPVKCSDPKFLTRSAARKSLKSQAAACHSMQDLVNANFEANRQLYNSNSSHHFLEHNTSALTASSSSSEQQQSTAQFQQLIQNLNQLELQEEHCQLVLPKITLTDYSQAFSYNNPPTNTQATNRNFNLKQSKLDFSQANKLEIPLELNYQSEARPP